MRVLLQRVSHAQVAIATEVVGKIQRGYLLLVGVADTDGQAEVDYLVRKITNLRIFEDSEQKMNLSIQDVSGEVLSVSQFTLYADTKKGNRPSFTKAGQPEHAQKIYQQFNEQLRKNDLFVAEGRFGADMQVELLNDGPVTILLDTDKK